MDGISKIDTPQGISPVDGPTEERAPQEPTPTTAPEGPFVDVNGKQVPISELQNAYVNKTNWQATNTQAAQELRRKEAALREREEQWAWTQELERTFGMYPGMEEDVKNAIGQVHRKYAMGTAAATPMGQPSGQPIQTQVAPGIVNEMNQLREEFHTYREQVEMGDAWRSFKSEKQISPIMERAIRGTLPFIDDTGRSYREMLDAAYDQVATMMQPTTQPTAQPNRLAALGTPGPGAPAMGRPQPVDYSGKTLAQREADIRAKFLRGDYSK